MEPEDFELEEENNAEDLTCPNCKATYWVADWNMEKGILLFGFHHVKCPKCETLFGFSCHPSYSQ